MIRDSDIALVTRETRDPIILTLECDTAVELYGFNIISFPHLCMAEFFEIMSLRLG